MRNIIGLVVSCLFVAACGTEISSVIRPCPNVQEAGVVLDSGSAVSDAAAPDSGVSTDTSVPSSNDSGALIDDAVDVMMAIDAPAVTDGATPDADVAGDVSDAPSSPDADDHLTAPLGSLIYRGVYGDYWFCGEYDASRAPVYGYRGCCTNGRFLRQEDFGRPDGIYAGTYVRTTDDEIVYYIMRRSDGSLARVTMATVTILNSWAQNPASTSHYELVQDPGECAGVFMTTPAQLATVPLAGIGPYRAGTTYVRRFSDSVYHDTYYVAGAHRTLHPVTVDGSAAVARWWIEGNTIVVPDFIFALYTIGAPVDVASYSENSLTVLHRFQTDELLIDLFP